MAMGPVNFAKLRERLAGWRLPVSLGRPLFPSHLHRALAPPKVRVTSAIERTVSAGRAP
jgi:hypothetical protein